MRHHNLFYGSSYDRGLDILLKLWPRIRTAYPDATLDICYGWDLFDKGYANNPERMAWKERMNKAMAQKGITHHGRCGKTQLAKIRAACGVWAYPTYFTEINCITGLECQRDGLVPVVMKLGALPETVKAGELVSGDIYDEDAQEAWLHSLLAVMGEQEKWAKQSKKAVLWAEKFTWPVIAKQWAAYFV